MSHTWPCPVLPGDPPAPCPDLLTPEEAVRYLRLDATSNRKPYQTLCYYQERGLLRPTYVGKHKFYRRVELDRFLDKLTEEQADMRATKKGVSGCS